jgi:hypothetical protein
MRFSHDSVRLNAIGSRIPRWDIAVHIER